MLNYNMLYVHQSKVNKILLLSSKNDSFFWVFDEFFFYHRMERVLSC